MTDLTDLEILKKLQAGDLPTHFEGPLYERAIDMRRKGLLAYDPDKGWSLTDKGEDFLKEWGKNAE